MASSETAWTFGLWIVIVYPSVPPGAAVAESAVFVVDKRRPTERGEDREVRTRAEPPTGSVRSQLRPAPLST